MTEKRWAKVIDNNTKEVQIGIGQDEQFYKDIGMTLLDVEQSYLGGWYLSGYAPQKPEPTIQDKILELEGQITARNLRSAIFGDEYAIEKIRAIEAEIEDLRKQLEE